VFLEDLGACVNGGCREFTLPFVVQSAEETCSLFFLHVVSTCLRRAASTLSHLAAAVPKWTGGSVVNIAYRLSLACEEINGWFGPIEANSERTKKVHHRLM